MTQERIREEENQKELPFTHLTKSKVAWLLQLGSLLGMNLVFY